MPNELLRAELLHLWIAATFEPAGEECGTVYDESRVCLRCRAGRIRKGPLILNLNRVPKGAGFAKTIAFDEWVVSGETVAYMRNAGIRGAELLPAKHAGRLPKITRKYFELKINSVVELSGKTQYGIDPINTDKAGKFRCPLSGVKNLRHSQGLNQLSELFVKRSTWDGSDIVRSAQYVGDRGGLLAPHPLILISRRLYQLLKSQGVRGYDIEVAHLVD